MGRSFGQVMPMQNGSQMGFNQFGADGFNQGTTGQNNPNFAMRPGMRMYDQTQQQQQQSLVGPAQGGMAPGYSEQARDMLASGDQAGAMQLLQQGTGSMPVQQQQTLRPGQPAFQTVPAQQQQQSLVGPNVNQTSANAYGAAVDKVQQGMNFNPMMMSGAMPGMSGMSESLAGQVPGMAGTTGTMAGTTGTMGGTTGTMAGQGNTMAGAPTLAGNDLSAYQNPFQQQVFDTSMNALNQANQKALNNVGAGAGSAFGNDRHQLVEAETNRQFGDAAAAMGAKLGMQGYNSMQDAARFDINNSNANNQFDINNARSDLSFDINNARGDNQFDINNLRGDNQFDINNLRGDNVFDRNSSRSDLSFDINNQRGDLQQDIAGMRSDARFDINNDMAGNAAQMNAANQMGGLSQQGFNYGQTLNNNMSGVGNQQQNLIQQIMNAANGQYGDVTNYSQNQLSLPLQALGLAPANSSQTATQTKTPGLFDYLTLGAQGASGTDFSGLFN